MARVLNVLLIFALICGAYVYRAQARVFGYQIIADIAPCKVAIPYSIGTIDPDFGVSRADVARAARDAVAVWEKAAGRDLFTEVQSDPVIPVNLEYDLRQETTQTLQNLGQQITNTSAKYDSLNAEYSDKRAQYVQAKGAFDAAAAAYEADARAYEQEVQSWNSRGGAPRSEVQKLNNEKASLEARRSALESQQVQVNALADEVNALARRLNSIAGDINATAKTYNKVGAQTGDEFEEGVFESSAGRESITVFQFDSQARLRRLLAHEFGHALGLDHVEGSDSIMYRLNEGSSIAPTPEDIAALKAQCRL